MVAKEAKGSEAPATNEPEANEISLAITKWAKHLGENKAMAQDCAIMALTHCFNHRDAVYLQRMLEVISEQGQDYVRKTPFLVWCNMFAPVKMVEKVLVFDKDSTITDKVLPEAKAMLWWRTVKETVVNPFDANSAVNAALSAVRKFKNNDKWKDSGGGSEEVTRIENFLTQERDRIQAAAH